MCRQGPERWVIQFQNGRYFHALTEIDGQYTLEVIHGGPMANAIQFESVSTAEVFMRKYGWFKNNEARIVRFVNEN